MSNLGQEIWHYAPAPESRDIANLKAALPLLPLLAPHAGLGDLSALGSLIAYGTKTGPESSYTLFLGVD